MNDASKRWSRDWAKFDWEPVNRKINEAVRLGIFDREHHPDLGISAEEYLEFLDWLREEGSLLYWQFLTKRFLLSNGISE